MKQLHQFKVFFYDVESNILAVETFHNVMGRQDFFERLAKRLEALEAHDLELFVDGSLNIQTKREFYATQYGTSV